ncbi:MAG: hypothetical protein IIB83_01770 [Bacteroidetes bacterium]|nr:hypothetical protein [Bacteroidota bacterium]
MKKFSFNVLLMFCIGVIILISVQEVKAIPDFARKYKTSCSTCHYAIPKRNAFGEAFRRNGYVMPMGDAEFIKRQRIPLGAPAWKEVFPDAIYPGWLPGSFPISAYIHQRVVYAPPEGGTKIDFDMPHEFEIFVGGSFGEKFSFFGEWVMFEKGKNAPGLKRFFFQINDLIGPDNAFNIRVGRLEPGITEGYVDNNRITLEHAMTLDYKATGKWRPRDQQSGIELRGIINHRFQYAVGVVNGEKSTINDKTDEKDIYGRVAFKFGGLALDGYEPAGMDALKQIDNWADNALTIGAYIYQGNYQTSNLVDNDFNRFGFDLHANLNRFDFFAGAIFGTDDNPSGLTNATNLKKELNSTAWFVEGQYLLYPWLIAGVRVGGVTSDQNNDDVDKYTLISPNITILARANVRFTVEGLIRIKGDKTIGGITIPAINDDKVSWIKLNMLFVM